MNSHQNSDLNPNLYYDFISAQLNDHSATNYITYDEPCETSGEAQPYNPVRSWSVEARCSPRQRTKVLAHQDTNNLVSDVNNQYTWGRSFPAPQFNDPWDQFVETRLLEPTDSRLSRSKPHDARKYFCELCDSPADGFRTEADLGRHRRGIHAMYEPGDKIWRCQFAGCSSADKLWPRRDNFSAHLKRMHFNGDDKKVKEVIDSFLEYYDPVKHGSKRQPKTEKPRVQVRRAPAQPKTEKLRGHAQTAPARISMYSAAEHLAGGSLLQVSGLSLPQQKSIENNQMHPDIGAVHFTNQIDPWGPADSELAESLPSAAPALHRISSRMRIADFITAPSSPEARSRRKREMEEQEQAVNSPTQTNFFIQDIDLIGVGISSGSQKQIEHPFPETDYLLPDHAITLTGDHHGVDVWSPLEEAQDTSDQHLLVAQDIPGTQSRAPSVYTFVEPESNVIRGRKRALSPESRAAAREVRILHACDRCYEKKRKVRTCSSCQILITK